MRKGKMIFNITGNLVKWRYAVCSLLLVSIFLSLMPSVTYAYDKDTHYYFKYYLLRKVGFNQTVAAIIAKADQSTDSGGTAPGFARKNNNPNWHALASKEKNDARQADLWNIAKNALNAENLEENPLERKLVPFGQFLHFLEDRTPHETFGWFWGHAFKGHRVDYLSYHSDETIRGEVETWLLFMSEFYELLTGEDANAVGWDDVKEVVGKLKDANPTPRFWSSPDSTKAKDVINDALHDEIAPNESINPSTDYEYNKSGDLVAFNIRQRRFSFTSEAVECHNDIIQNATSVIENSPYFPSYPEAAVAVQWLHNFLEEQFIVDPSIDPIRYAITNLTGLAQDDADVLNETTHISALMLDSVFTRERHVLYLRSLRGFPLVDSYMEQAYEAVALTEPEITKMETNPSDVDFDLVADNLAKAWEYLRDAEPGGFHVCMLPSLCAGVGPRIDDFLVRYTSDESEQALLLMIGEVDTAGPFQDPQITRDLWDEGFTLIGGSTYTHISLYECMDSWASRTASAPGLPDDTVRGIVASNVFSQNMYWEGNVDPIYNPYGIGGRIRSAINCPTCDPYHPALASTTEEWSYLLPLFDPLVNLDPYTYEMIPWMANDWQVEPISLASVILDGSAGTFGPGTPDWCYPGNNVSIVDGVNTTFHLRDDLFWHDGVQYTSDDAEFALEYLRDWTLDNSEYMWANLVDVQTHGSFAFSVLHNTSWYPWIFDEISRWATMFPKHIYNGKNPSIHTPWLNPHPTVDGLTELIGTGALVHRTGEYEDWGYAYATAYSTRNLGYGTGGIPDPAFVPTADPLTTHWLITVGDLDHLLIEMFHWIGDVDRDGIIDVYDLARMGMSYALVSGDPGYHVDADTDPEPMYHTNDGRVDIRDIIELSKNWGKQRTYA